MYKDELQKYISIIYNYLGLDDFSKLEWLNWLKVCNWLDWGGIGGPWQKDGGEAIVGLTIALSWKEDGL